MYLKEVGGAAKFEWKVRKCQTLPDFTPWQQGFPWLQGNQVWYRWKGRKQNDSIIAVSFLYGTTPGPHLAMYEDPVVNAGWPLPSRDRTVNFHSPSRWQRRGIPYMCHCLHRVPADRSVNVFAVFQRFSIVSLISHAI